MNESARLPIDPFLECLCKSPIRCRQSCGKKARETSSHIFLLERKARVLVRKRLIRRKPVCVVIWVLREYDAPVHRCVVFVDCGVKTSTLFDVTPNLIRWMPS